MRKILGLLAACWALPATADTIDPYDAVFVFGDSLSDSGNIAASLGPDFPTAVYPNGQFTNGAEWTTQIGLSPSLLGGNNYAFGGARTADNGDATPDLLAQIGMFTASAAQLGANPLAVIWTGGNDFRDLAPGDDLGAFVTSITHTIAKGVRLLNDAGIEDFVVFNLPNFSALPEYAGDALGAGQASFVTGVVNGAIAKKVSRLDNRYDDASVGLFDIDSLFQEVLASAPEATRQLRCLDDLADCAANPTNYVFYDDIHPMEWVHSELARQFSAAYLSPELSAVPLPAGATLLLTGFAGFGVWARRRKSQA